MKRGNEKEINRQYIEDTALTPELFSIKQVREACGLSRSMLIKLEDAGFLTPVRVDTKTGYRWYDMLNIGKLEQYLLFRALGLSLKEIEDIYSDDAAAAEELLLSLANRFQLMQRCVEELSLRLGKIPNSNFSIVHLPRLTCLCGTDSFASMRDMERFAFNLHSTAVKRGYRLLPTEPIFTLREVTRTERGVEYAQSVKICIAIDPAIPQGCPTDGVEVIPGCRALTMLFRGDFRSPEALGSARAAIWEELDRREWTADGPFRTLGIVAPYVDTRAEAEDFVMRFAIPLKEG